jgi:uncharacterized protein YbjT (DUF2867 family)
MDKTILLLGATGNLGGKIADALLQENAKVKALVRTSTDTAKIAALEAKGIQVVVVDTNNIPAIAAHCAGAHCMVSALAGLQDTIIDTQKNFLDAAVQAGVPRFIASDYCIDYTNLVPGKNRNLDSRRDFAKLLDSANIQATSIFNGAFMELLTGEMPLILFKKHKILCWGNPNQLMEFTTTHNIANYTAKAALEASTSRHLHIAGDKLSCANFVTLMAAISGRQYKIFRPGGIGLLNTLIKITRFFSPAKKELYPAWQGMQYMRDMMEGRIDVTKNDNARHKAMQWTTVKDYLLHSQKTIT